MLIYFITHPDVVIDPKVAVPDWHLSRKGVARMRSMLTRPFIKTIRSVRSSTERKARDGAAILVAATGASYREVAELGEIDRSATGYLPREEFETVADAFFANPKRSVRGWERAVDAQQRIVDAVETINGERGTRGNLAIVSHGGVGALLLCHLTGRPITREADQPRNNGGNFFSFERTTMRLMHGWQPIDAVIAASRVPGNTARRR